MAGFLPNDLTGVGATPASDDVFVIQQSGSSEVKKVTYSEILGSTVDDSAIGVTIQPYDVNTVVDSAYVHTDYNYDFTAKTKIDLISVDAAIDLDKVVLDSDIGVSVASLVNGTIPSTQLPSYVDDVIEAPNFASLPSGESGKLYVTTDDNKTFRWSGTAFVEIGSGLYASDIGITIQPYDVNTVVDTSYVHTDTNYVLADKTKVDYISVTGAVDLDTVVSDSDIGVTVQGYDVNTVVDSNYVHTDNNYLTADKTKVDFISVTQAIDLDTITSSSDIGVTVQGYDANTVIDSAYVHTDTNYTAIDKAKVDYISVTQAVDLDTVVSDSDIGITVQAYDVNTVVDTSYVHTDTNYTAIDKAKVDYISVTQAVDLDTVLVDGDIGITVQGYDVNTVVDSDYVHTDTNYVLSDKTKVDYISVTGAIDLDTVLVDGDIGITVQGYDVNTVVDSDYVATKATINTGGDTASRPASPVLYQSYFDITLGYPIWYNGSNWVDAVGTVV